MTMSKSVLWVAILTAGSGLVPAQETSERSQAMGKFDFMRGVWRGPASGVNRDGTRFSVTQTERIGPLLNGDVMVVEGRGYKADGTTAFNALGVISYDAGTKKYEFRSYAMGYAGTFAIVPTLDGYVWEIPAGPGVIRYTATVKDGNFHEIGESVFPGKPVARIFEMNLKKVGETDWPLGKAVGPN